MRFVKSIEELEKSKILWPITPKGTVVFFIVDFLLISSIILSLTLCDLFNTCSRASWGDFWGEYNYSPDMYSFCEEARDANFISQRMNSFSNFAFGFGGTIQIGAGVADYYRLRVSDEHKRRNHVSEWPLFSFYYGLGSWLLCFGSFLFHAHKTDLTQTLDVGFMYVALTPVVFYTVLFFVDVNLKPPYLAIVRAAHMFSMILTGTMMTVFKKRFSSAKALPGMIFAFAIVLTIFIITRLIPMYINPKWSIYPAEQASWRFRRFSLSILSGIVLIGAFLVQENIGLKDLPCDSESLWQFHAFWHVLCATSLSIIYLFIRSEYITYEDEIDGYKEEKELVVEL